MNLQGSANQEAAPGTLAEKFKSLAIAMSELGKQAGVRIRSFNQASLPHFNQLAADKQRAVIAHLQITTEVWSALHEEGRDLGDSPTLTRRMLKRLGLRADSEIFDMMTPDCIVEIYTMENVQIFRNLQFFEISSYTIEDLMCREWWELYSRDDSITREIFSWGARVFGGEITTPCSPMIPDHILREKESEMRFLVETSFDHLAAVYLHGKVFAVVCVERGRVVNTSPALPELTTYQAPVTMLPFIPRTLK